MDDDHSHFFRGSITSQLIMKITRDFAAVQLDARLPPWLPVTQLSGGHGFTQVLCS